MTTINYKKVKFDEMYDYVDSLNDDEAMLKFLNAGMTNEVELIDLLDKDGKPITYVNKKGETKIKKARKEKVNGELRRDRISALKYFYEEYKDAKDIEWINSPKTSSEEKEKADKKLKEITERYKKLKKTE